MQRRRLRGEVMKANKNIRKPRREVVDFEKRARQDSYKRLEGSFAEILRKGKKR